MAEKKQSKGYSAGNGKRWLLGIASIVLIAIMVVVIVIAIPPNTNSAVDILNRATVDSFMVSQKEKTSFDNFEAKVANSKQVNNYIKVIPTEMEDVQTLSVVMAEVVDYFNDYMFFIEKTKGFKKNAKEITKSFKDAFESQRQLNAILAEVNKLNEQSPTYLQNVWIDFRAEYVEWLGYYQTAIAGLTSAYQEGMGNSTYNNLASTIILNTANDYISCLINGFNEMLDYEKENPNATTYEYKLKGMIKGFELFVKAQIVDDEDIQNYSFSFPAVKSKYSRIEQYFELYGETDMSTIIPTIEYISESPVVTHTYTGVNDVAYVYDSVKLFVVGGV